MDDNQKKYNKYKSKQDVDLESQAWISLSKDKLRTDILSGVVR